MPSPFPGMDPLIEAQWWRDFHYRFIPQLAIQLTPVIRPRYVTTVEEHVYLAQESDEDIGIRIPDVSVLQTDADVPIHSVPVEASETATMIAPAVRTLSLPKLTREIYLVIRERQSLRVVTVIELLSPTNKSGKGRREYLSKRAEILESQSHLVEIDLLRGGSRPATIEPLPPGDYYAFVCRQERLPDAEIYAWPLRHRLPTIPIPLAEDDADVPLDLQQAFTTVYDQAAYDVLIDYDQPLKPRLRKSDADWIRDILKANDQNSRE